MQNNSLTMATEQVSKEELLRKVKEIGPDLSRFVTDERNDRRLSRSVIGALREAGLYRLYLPKSLDGFEADPITTARIVEDVSSYNAAAGWSLMVANTSTWWCARLSDKGIDEFFENGPDTFMAGAFHPPMRATLVEGGYRINGRSPLTSNVHEAQWIFVTALVMSDGEIKMNNGIPEVRGVVMRSEDCKIIDTWHTHGMRATDSNDVESTDVFVPDHLTFPLTQEFEPNRHYKGKLYRFPAMGASIASLIPPVALALARNAITELRSLAEKKIPFGSTVSIRERGSVQRKLGMAEAYVQSSRAYLHLALSEAWQKTILGEKLSLEEKAGLLLASSHTNQMCLQAVDMMYSAAGTSGIYSKNKLSHYFADAQVIRHHGFANDSRYETAAQVYLGLQPDLPVIAF